MMLGMSLSTFTTVHVIISLVAIVSGLIVLLGMFSAKRYDGLTALFLLTTVLTSVTGFGFPFSHLSPAHKVGIISLVLLAIAILARYSFKMVGKWRWIYGHGDRRSLSQRVRTGSAVFRESSRFECLGPNAN